MKRQIKYYADDHVAKAVIEGLRRREVDVLTVVEAGLMGAADERQLQKARKDNRAFTTQDEDLPMMHIEGLHYEGSVFSLRNTSIGDVIRGLVLIHHVLDATEMCGHVVFL